MDPFGSDYLDRPKRTIDEATIDRVIGQQYSQPHALLSFLRGLSVPMAIVRVSDSVDDQHVVYINDAVTDLFGYTLRDVMYRLPNTFCYDPGSSDPAQTGACLSFATTLKRHGRAGGRFRIQHRNGAPLAVQVIAGLLTLDAAKEQYYVAFAEIVRPAAEMTEPEEKNSEGGSSGQPRDRG